MSAPDASQGLPDSRETRMFAAELLQKVPRAKADRARARPESASPDVYH